MIKAIGIATITLIAAFILAMTVACCRAASMAANDEMEDNDR